VANRPLGPKILIVDDDEEGVRTFARILKLEGYSVQTAFTAEMGLYEAQLSQPDAIILDFHMPLVDGLGFLRRLRAQAAQRATPVAIITADYFLDDSLSNEIAKLGAEVAHKPLFSEQLLGLARHLLEVTH
jgi:DNA-binding response OmpR family regulator